MLGSCFSGITGSPDGCFMSSYCHQDMSGEPIEQATSISFTVFQSSSDTTKRILVSEQCKFLEQLYSYQLSKESSLPLSRLDVSLLDYVDIYVCNWVLCKMHLVILLAKAFGFSSLSHCLGRICIPTGPLSITPLLPALIRPQREADRPLEPTAVVKISQSFTLPSLLAV